MRADPRDYQLVSPGTLQGVLSLLSSEPTQWLPIAGGTDVMVLYAAGKLPNKKLVNLWNVPELRQIGVSPDQIRIGAACSYTALRKQEVISREFPLLATAASWTGGIANQNRGTLGGNIANASPAADSLPALLVYDAELSLVSGRGERRVPYRNFHTGYKQTALAPDELILDIVLPRRFSGYVAHAKKVGARKAQAISKVCLAALGRVTDGMIRDIRVALGSVAPVPLRLTETERTLTGKKIEPSLIESARKTVAQEIRPIDDVRSTARYRIAVAGNLVAEFLEKLALQGQPPNNVLSRWNGLPSAEAAREILPCCGSTNWAARMASRRPIIDETSLLAAADAVWRSLGESDWLEAFRSHPRIGETHPEKDSAAQSSAWSVEEQHKAATADEAVAMALKWGNREYEQKFGRIFIVCATGKSASEILEVLRRRLHNDDATELQQAVGEQWQIMHIRLKKWIAE
jgi:OHCU decarboxylase